MAPPSRECSWPGCRGAQIREARRASRDARWPLWDEAEPWQDLYAFDRPPRFDDERTHILTDRAILSQLRSQRCANPHALYSVQLAMETIRSRSRGLELKACQKCVRVNFQLPTSNSNG